MEETSEPSEEKIKEYEAKMSRYYNARLPFLRIKHEHDIKMAEIAEARIRNLRAHESFMQYEMAQKDLQDRASKEDNKDGGN